MTQVVKIHTTQVNKLNTVARSLITASTAARDAGYTEVAALFDEKLSWAIAERKRLLKVQHE